MAPIDDGALVAAAKGGDRRAMDALLRAHHDRVSAVCRHLLGNPADAADATQNALISAVRGLPRFDGTSSFGTWIYRIATNAALDELRRRARRPGPIDTRATGDADLLADRPAPAAASAFDTVEERMVLTPALASLSDDYRIAVVLRDVADLDYAEIAELLGIPPGTVRSRIARGRAALAAALRTDDVTTEPGTRSPGADVQSDEP